MAAGSTYTPIATTTLGSSTSSFTFSSIPSTYTDLVLVCNYLSENTNGQGYIRFNSDSSSNYSRTAVYGTGSSAASFRQSNNTGCPVGMSASTDFQTIIMQIMGYSNGSTYTTVLDREQNAGVTLAQVFTWRSASVVNSISIQSFDGSSSIQAGATFTLYGIAAA